MRNSKLVLLMFTATYPYDAGAEQTFIGGELPYLVKQFDIVILIPKKCAGKRLDILDEVDIEEGLSDYIKKSTSLGVIYKALTSRFFYRDILHRPIILLHLSMLSRLIRFVGDATLTGEWLKGWLERKGIEIGNTVFYTFWFDQLAMGVGLVKELFPELKLVSRAHGYDVYEERYNPPYWPCRSAALKTVDALFLVSNSGADYLRKRYPAFSTRIQVAFLGVPDSGFITRPSSDGIFRIASCSIVRPIKRVELLLDGIVCAARQRPHQEFEWYHFGVGEEVWMLENLKQYADKILPPNVHAFFPGYTTQQALMEFYKANPFDVFYNVSVSEGIPVSSMEAISCGIPIVATAVGGNCEIVTDENGILLSPNPSPNEIADSIYKFIDFPEIAEKKRARSFALWQDKFNADINFNAFARSLISIRERKN